MVKVKYNLQRTCVLVNNELPERSLDGTVNKALQSLLDNEELMQAFDLLESQGLQFSPQFSLSTFKEWSWMGIRYEDVKDYIEEDYEQILQLIRIRRYKQSGKKV